MPRYPPQRRSPTALRRAADGESTRTIVIAFLANIVIATAKLVAGLASGSTGMLAEAAHSAADSVNEIFLAVGLRRARQPADETHPLGHGRERFLWGFLAALAIGVLLAVTAFGLARPFADFLVGKSLPEPLLEKLVAIVDEDPAIEQVLSIRAIYTGPEEVIVAAKVRPSPSLSVGELARAMDDLDRRIRQALPLVADVFVDVTAYRGEDDSQAGSPRSRSGS